MRIGTFKLSALDYRNFRAEAGYFRVESLLAADLRDSHGTENQDESLRV